MTGIEILGLKLVEISGDVWIFRKDDNLLLLKIHNENDNLVIDTATVSFEDEFVAEFVEQFIKNLKRILDE